MKASTRSQPVATATRQDVHTREQELGARALAGDADAFSELYSLHEQGLQAVVYRLTGNREDAADIAQEAFLRVFSRLDALAERPDVNLSAYLFRTARNLVYDHGGRAGREVLQDDLERSAGADAEIEIDPERSSLVDAQVEEVRAANARLPERYRLVLALRELEGMSYEELGQALGVSTAAAGQALVRARLALRHELRLEQIDVESLDPELGSRLRDIGAYIDGELDGDARREVERLLSGDERARRIKAAFEEAGERYRAWLPLPAILVGDRIAHAAEARGLLEPASSRGPRAAGAGGALRAMPGRVLAARPRLGRAAVVGAAFLLVLLFATATARVGLPEAEDPEPVPEAPVETAEPDARARTTPAGATVSDPVDVPAAAQAPAPAAPTGAAHGAGAATAAEAPGGTTTQGQAPSRPRTSTRTTAPAAVPTPEARPPDSSAPDAPEPATDPAAPSDEPTRDPAPVEPDPAVDPDPGRDPTPPGTSDPDSPTPTDPDPKIPPGPGIIVTPGGGGSTTPTPTVGLGGLVAP